MWRAWGYSHLRGHAWGTSDLKVRLLESPGGGGWGIHTHVFSLILSFHRLP